MQTKNTTKISLGASKLIPQEFWPWTVLLFASFVLIHWAFFLRMYWIALDDSNWSHAFIVPVISFYYIYQHRYRLMTIQAQTCIWGLPFMVLGIFSYMFGVNPISNLMLQGYGMILALFGLVLFLLGPRMIAILWFPIIYLAFGVKVSQRIWDWIAVQLQWIAANCSTVTLKFFSFFMDFDVDNSGSTINLTQNKFNAATGMIKPVTDSLNVAEACAGLRMLMAFLALGVATAFLWKRPVWQRIIMVLMTLPIAVAVNVGRVTSLGLLTLINPDYAKGDFHLFIGMMMLAPALGLFLLMGWIMDRVVITDKPKMDEEEVLKRDAARLTAERIKEPLLNPIKLALWFFAGAIAMGFASVLYAVLVENPIGLLELTGINGLAVNSLIKLSYTLIPPTIIIFAAVIILSKISPIESRSVKLQSFSAFALAILLIGFPSMQINNARTNTVLFKKAVPTRYELVLIPRQISSWKLKQEDPPLSQAILDELGTTNYVSRTYEDTDRPVDDPLRYIRFHSAYYTGTVDTVPHVPERCYVAGGATSLNQGTSTISVGGTEYFEDDETENGHIAYSTLMRGDVRIPKIKDIPVSYMSFQPPSQQQGKEIKATVMYFFIANGKFLATPDAVRLKGTETSDEYSYYSKVEVSIQTGDLDEAKNIAQSFLSAYLPEVMACLPDWVDVESGKWPEQ
ncbi:exosortase/archaeosortase family protein [Poriferisphaera corsica]|uniref:exosortase/archaeosortase family protein n=1 Tax=Poriferisphaera corsica TaxID=2528020 RepID=UPI00190C9241|nr:exosortase/archaeosortase family protein [Poriferisphaera corsica]